MFLHHLVEMGGFALNHHWRGINVLSVLECCLLAAVLFAALTLLFSFVRKSRRLRIASIIATLTFATAAYAANTALSALSASGALAGANLIYVVQTVGTGGVKATMTQVATFINSLFSGDFTCTSGGSCTITKIGGVAVPSPIGTVASVGAGCGTSTGGSAITTTGNVIAALSERVNTSASDPIVAADCGGIVYENSASSVAASLAQAGTTGFATGTFFAVCNTNAGVVTITPTTSTIGGQSTLAVNAGTAAHPTCVGFKSDGTNYKLTEPPLGSGVAAALGNALSAAGGLTSTIASGTSALGTGAISSATCATVVTTTATNTATTDVVLASFNGDPTAVTGYIPATAGMLTIIAYPTSGNVNFKVCNNTSSSVTPGAITLNWRVVR